MASLDRILFLGGFGLRKSGTPVPDQMIETEQPEIGWSGDSHTDQQYQNPKP